MWLALLKVVPKKTPTIPDEGLLFWYSVNTDKQGQGSAQIIAIFKVLGSDSHVKSLASLQ
jgi:hypothetical protein